MNDNINRPDTLVIHHTNVSTRRSQILPVNRYHKILRYPKSRLGWYVGYHIFIEKTGATIRTRDDDERGAHTLHGWNERSIGVALAGNFNSSVPTRQQLDSLRKLIKHYNLPYKFHHEADRRRTCAGFYFTRELIENKPKPIPVIEIEKRESIQSQISAIKAILAKIAESLRKL